MGEEEVEGRMNFIDFLKTIDRMGFGLASFNTYRMDNQTWCFILVSQIGDSGFFLKRECQIANLKSTLHMMYNEICQNNLIKNKDA